MFRARSAVHCVCIAGSGPEQNTGRTEHYTKYVHNNAPWAKEHRHAFHSHSLPLLHPMAGESLSMSVCPTHTMCLTFCNPSVGTPPPTLSLGKALYNLRLFLRLHFLTNQRNIIIPNLLLCLYLCALPFSRIILNFGPFWIVGGWKRGMDRGRWWTSSRCGYRRDWVAMY